MTTQAPATREAATIAPLPAPAEAASKGARVVFIDALRLLALAQMVNGHTLDAVMLDSVREAALFPPYDYLRGLVSVAFMFAAGLAYHLTTFVRFDPERARAGRRKRVLRAFFLVAVGYAMRSSPRLFSDDPVVFERAFEYFCRIDVLHCIGFSILVLELITWAVRSASQARIAAASVAAVLLAVAPLTARLPIGPENRIWLGWLTHEGQSFFPIAPWAAYVLLGATLGGIVAPAEGGAKKAPARLLVAAAASYALSMLLRAAFPSLGDGIHPASDPAFFLEKLAALLALTAPLAFLVRDVSALPRPLVVLTGETLVVYVFHLLALFLPHAGPARLFRHTLELPVAMLVAAAMLVVSFGVGLGAPVVRRYFFALVGRLRGRSARAALARADADADAEAAG